MHQLPPGKGCEDPVPFDQLVEAAAFDDTPGVEHIDPVDIPDRAEPVGDHQAGYPEFFQRVLNNGLGAIVERTGGFVEQEDSPLAGEGARAISSRCFCPTESPVPPSGSTVRIPIGIARISSSRAAARAVAQASSALNGDGPAIFS